MGRGNLTLRQECKLLARKAFGLHENQREIHLAFDFGDAYYTMVALHQSLRAMTSRNEDAAGHVPLQPWW